MLAAGAQALELLSAATADGWSADGGCSSGHLQQCEAACRRPGAPSASRTARAAAHSTVPVPRAMRSRTYLLMALGSGKLECAAALAVLLAKVGPAASSSSMLHQPWQPPSARSIHLLWWR